MSLGRVFLVGAGPGRPDLLTLRGAALLARADVVVLDALVDRRLLAHCRPKVRVIDAGKRGHGKVFLTQPAINRTLVRWARAGKNVVRLKGGDPYLFGRGGEEAECLARAGIPFEVVPGVSSVLAAPSFAGIPLTHRGLASTVTIVTGHGQRENAYLRESPQIRRSRRAPDVDWAALPRDGTLVVLMGVSRLAEIVLALTRAGWDPGTPAAAVMWGSWSTQKSVTGTLATLPARVTGAGVGPPAVLVFGRVVTLAPVLDWFTRRPLFGKTVLVTRPADQASLLSSCLEEKGARVMECPVIKISLRVLTPLQKKQLSAWSSYDAVLFTSANAVAAVTRLFPRGVPRGPAVYAIGSKTAAALAAAGVSVFRAADDANAEGLARVLGRSLRGKSFLFPRALKARDYLVTYLEKHGARLTWVPVYETKHLVPPAEVKKALARGAYDAVTFTSTSTVDALLSGFSRAAVERLFSKTRAIAIGPVTAAALRGRGVPRPWVSSGATVESLADRVEKEFV